MLRAILAVVSLANYFLTDTLTALYRLVPVHGLCNCFSLVQFYWSLRTSGIKVLHGIKSTSNLPCAEAWWPLTIVLELRFTVMSKAQFCRLIRVTFEISLLCKHIAHSDLPQLRIFWESMDLPNAATTKSSASTWYRNRKESYQAFTTTRVRWMDAGHNVCRFSVIITLWRGECWPWQNIQKLRHRITQQLPMAVKWLPSK